jgi:hypothetical protein
MKANKEKLKKAVSVTYEDELRAPIVSAKGQGYVAEKIIEKATGKAEWQRILMKSSLNP